MNFPDIISLSQKYNRVHEKHNVIITATIEDKGTYTLVFLEKFRGKEIKSMRRFADIDRLRGWFQQHI